ncbi:hypothetical protein JG687_00012755 [Phytophthora cactorum]|uniref:Uncharacterized protein n=1 Tax=Phytophthora cactorum TaxID=29920 RepID=A0A8T1U688_9STRA|nr:hypothetical protein JG687_00012755 [Phytophthora cactorum]
MIHCFQMIGGKVAGHLRPLLTKLPKWRFNVMLARRYAKAWKTCIRCRRLRLSFLLRWSSQFVAAAFNSCSTSMLQWSFNSALDDCSAELKPSSQTVLFVILAVEAFYLRVPLCFS